MVSSSKLTWFDNLAKKVADFEIRTRYTVFNQAFIMLKRNFILNIRFRKSIFLQTILAPFFFVFLLFIIQLFYNARQSNSLPNPYSYPLGGVPLCQGNTETSPCITLFYTPDTQATRLIMRTFAQKNALRTGNLLEMVPTPMTSLNPPTSKMGIVPVLNDLFINDYVIANQNTTEYGVSFSGTFPSVKYQIWYNNSQTLNGTSLINSQLISLQRGLDEALLSIANTPNAIQSPSESIQPVNATLRVTFKDWPVVPPKTIPDAIISRMGPMFFFCSVIVIFISVLQFVVNEKELKLRHAMEMMGLNPLVYWFTLLFNQMVLTFIAALVTCILGLIFQFTIFTQTNFGVTLSLFFLFGLAMVSFGFLTTFSRTTRSAVLQGMFVLIGGLLFQSFVFSSNFIGYIFFSSLTPRSTYFSLILLPFFNFGKVFLDLSLYTTGKIDAITQTSIPGPGFLFSDLFNPIPSQFIPNYDNATVDVPKPYISYLLLLMNIGLYFALTLYFDQILPDAYGKRRNLFFLLQPSFWLGSKNSNEELNQFIRTIQPLGNRPEFKVDKEDPDVAAERNITFDTSVTKEVRIGNLRKEYRNSLFWRSKLDKVAVKSLCLTLQEGQLLALLGQNGAGKSTTMSCLSGLTPPSQGDALIYGHSIRKHMDQIRSFLGICPQHDILFNDLTAMEHLQLYGGLKNLSLTEIARIAEERLKAVKLWKVKDQFAGTYSGGMKRRLSVVISSIGDPKIIFLDEPTTGMDPVNRRHVWSFLENFKKNRILVLTTHSMEEADVLADRIAIMVRGQLRALGSGVTLKNRYGEGYKIGLTVLPMNMEMVKSAIQQLVPEARLEDDSAGALLYRVSSSFLGKVPMLVRFLESEQGKQYIESWGLSQTSLEEVFLRLIRVEK